MGGAMARPPNATCRRVLPHPMVAVDSVQWGVCGARRTELKCGVEGLAACEPGGRRRGVGRHKGGRWGRGYRGMSVWVGVCGGWVGQRLGRAGREGGHWWLPTALVVNYILTKSGGGGSEAAVRGWGSAHAERERLTGVSE